MAWEWGLTTAQAFDLAVDARFQRISREGLSLCAEGGTLLGGHGGDRASLQDTFELSDGTRVTWGEATIEQYEEAARMLRAEKRALETAIARLKAER